jgi:hypothetical protein
MMAMRLPTKLGLLAAACLILLPIGEADAHRKRHHHHSHFGLGFNFVAPLYPYYRYRPYYAAPPAVVYVDPPASRRAAPVDDTEAFFRQGCREYTAPAQVAGETVETWGIACPQADGTWRIVR